LGEVREQEIPEEQKITICILVLTTELLKSSAITFKASMSTVEGRSSGSESSAG